MAIFFRLSRGACDSDDDHNSHQQPFDCGKCCYSYHRKYSGKSLLLNVFNGVGFEPVDFASLARRESNNKVVYQAIRYDPLLDNLCFTFEALSHVVNEKTSFGTFFYACDIFIDKKENKE